jgi:tetratricopeptide (TPR) repeat protein
MTSPDPPHDQGDQIAAWEHMNKAAFQAFQEGRPDEAEAMLLQAVADAEAPDADPALLIRSLTALARLYSRLYRHGKIEATLTRLLTVKEATLGDHHPDLVGTLQELAWEIGKCRQVERAEALYRRALAIDEATLGPNHPHLADSLRVLGVQLFFSKRYAESVEVLERGRAILEAHLDSESRSAPAVAPGPGHERADPPDTHREMLSSLDAVLGCLELAYTRWEHFAESELTLRRRLQIAEQRGDDGLMVGSILEKLGHVLQSQGKLAEADVVYQQAITTYDRWFESNRRAKRFRGGRPSRWSTSPLRAARHQYRGRLLHQRSLVLAGRGRHDEATHCLRQAERALRHAWSLNEPLGRNRGIVGYEPAMTFAAVLRARGKTAEADALQARAEADAQADRASRPLTHD